MILIQGETQTAANKNKQTNRQRQVVMTISIQSICRLLCWTFPLLLWDGIRLFAFVILLAPGFVTFAWYYWVASNRSSHQFGTDSCRQTLDVYSLLPRKINSRQQRNQNDNNSEEEETDDDNNTTNNTQQQQEERLLKAPVVIFFTGGAWMIGYKMWGTLLARALTQTGIVVVIPDMRNYPWGSVPKMTEDCELSIQWTLDNITRFGGDSSKIVVVGQSAGGHVACTSILRRVLSKLQKEKQQRLHDDDDDDNQALQESVGDKLSEEHEPNNNNEQQALVASESNTNSSWDLSDIKGFVSLSAPYDITAMQSSLSKHGLDENIVNSHIFHGQRNQYDPMQLLQQIKQQLLQQQSSSSSLPPAMMSLPKIQIYHGDKDKTVPYQGAGTFYKELCQVFSTRTNTREDGLSRAAISKDSSSISSIKFLIYENWSHTDPILEGPMDADHRCHKDIFDLVVKWTDATNLANEEVWASTSSNPNPILQKKLCPHILIEVARYCNPF